MKLPCHYVDACDGIFNEHEERHAYGAVREPDVRCGSRVRVLRHIKCHTWCPVPAYRTHWREYDAGQWRIQSSKHDQLNASILRGFEGPDPREILRARVHHCLDPRKMSEARLWNTYSEHIVTLLPPDASLGSKCTQNAFAAGALPGPRWGSLQRSPRPLDVLEGPLRGREGEEREREGTGLKGEGRGRREWEGKGREGKGKDGRAWHQRTLANCMSELYRTYQTIVLRSSYCHELTVPSVKLSVGCHRSFSVSGHTVWNLITLEILFFPSNCSNVI